MAKIPKQGFYSLVTDFNADRVAVIVVRFSSVEGVHTHWNIDIQSYKFNSIISNIQWTLDHLKQLELFSSSLAKHLIPTYIEKISVPVTWSSQYLENISMEF